MSEFSKTKLYPLNRILWIPSCLTTVWELNTTKDTYVNNGEANRLVPGVVSHSLVLPDNRCCRTSRNCVNVNLIGSVFVEHSNLAVETHFDLVVMCWYSLRQFCVCVWFVVCVC